MLKLDLSKAVRKLLCERDGSTMNVMLKLGNAKTLREREIGSTMNLSRYECNVCEREMVSRMNFNSNE